MPGDLLYDNAVNCAKLAQRTSRIVGVLWHQGEGDCAPEYYLTYKTRFETMMASLSNDLNLNDIPFILGGLGDFLIERAQINVNLINYPKINDALERIAEDNKLTGFVSAKGLTANADNLHFNSDSLYEFGLRYFKVFEQFKNNVGNHSTENIAEDIKRSEMELL